MANHEIRQAARDAGVRHWQIADKLKISESQFSRMLRYELRDNEKEKIFGVIHRLKEGAAS